MLDVSIDLTRMKAELKRARDDQIPFALSLAINTTAKGAIASIRTGLEEDFTIAPSRLPFMKRLIRFPRSQWATKRKPIATIGVHEKDSDFDVGSSSDRGFLLGRHEEGGERRRDDPFRPFFIPTDEIRGGDWDLPPRNLYPTALRIFDQRGVTGVLGADIKKAKRGFGGQEYVIKGKRRTFVVDGRQRNGAKAWGIFQRMGRGARNIRMIWAFRTSIHLPPRLRFYKKAASYIDTNFPRHFSEALERAMKTAK